MNVLALSLSAFCLTCAISACAADGKTPNQEEMLTKASALTKVARAVASAVQFKGARESLTEEELLRFATEHDPRMLEPFRGYALRVRRVGTATSVLMCTKDNSTGLIEDSGCTARSDARLWEQSRTPCTFQLNLDVICAR